MSYKIPSLAAVQTGLLASCVLIAMSSVLEAGTYFVGLDGLDSNPGTAEAPLRTIQRAANLMQPGDTAVIGPGSYAETVKTVRSGTVAAPITFLASDTNVVTTAFNINHAWQTVACFTFSDGTIPSRFAQVMLGTAAHGATVRDCTFLAGPAGVYSINMASSKGISPVTNFSILGNRFVEPNFHCITLYGSGHRVVGNQFICTKGWDLLRLLASNSRVASNLALNWSNLTGNGNHADLLQAFGSNGEIATNNVIESNLFANCTNCQIGCMESQPPGRVADWTWRNNIWSGVDWAMSLNAEGMTFQNNTFHRTGINTFGPIIAAAPNATKGTANRTVIQNNIFSLCGRLATSTQQGWYYIDKGLVGCSADYNLVVGQGTGRVKVGFVTAVYESHGINGALPGFNAADDLDFHLVPGSPCLGAGIDLGTLFTVDADENPRTAPWSIGAFQ